MGGPALANEMLLEVTDAETLNLLFGVWLASHTPVIYHGKNMTHEASVSDGRASRPALNPIQRPKQNRLRLTKEKTMLVVVAAGLWGLFVMCRYPGKSWLI